MRLKTLLLVAAASILVALVAAVIAIKSIDFNKYKGLIAQQVKAATGRDLAIAGDLHVAIGLSPTLAVNGVSFANASWGTRPQMVTMRTFEVQVALLPLIFRRIVVERLVLLQPNIWLETNARGVGNWSFGAAPAASGIQKPGKAGPGLTALAVQSVRIEKGTLTYLDGKTKRATTLTLERLDLQAKDLSSPVRIDLAAAYDRKAFTLAGTVGPLAELQAPSRPYPVALVLKSGGTTVNLNGTVAEPMEVSGLDLKVEAKALNLAEVARLAGASIPAVGPFVLAARVAGSPSALSVTGMNASVGKSTLTGKASIRIGTPHPRIEATLASTLLDLADLLPQGGTARTGAAGSGAAGLFPAEPLPLAALRLADANVELRADRVVLPDKMPIEAVVAHVQLADGRMLIQPLSSRVGGGTVSGQVGLDASGGTTAILTATIDAKGVLLGQVLAEMGRPELVSGVKTDASMDLKGSGDSIRSLLAGLDGSLLVVLGDGKIHSGFVNWLGADLVTEVVSKLNPLSKGGQSTNLKCGVVRFAAKDGIARTDRGIAFETDQMNVVSSGTVDLKSEAIDFSLLPEARQGIGIGAGQLVNLLRVRGTLTQPTVGVNEVGVAQMAATIGAAVATGGLSFLAQALIGKAMSDAHPCQTAMGAAPGRAKGGAAPSAGSEVRQEGSKVGTGIQQFFKGLFGK